VSRLSRELAVDRRTLTRWRRWWLEAFPLTAAYAEIRAAILPPPDAAMLPHSLVERYAGADLAERIAALLCHVARIEEAA
jgi:hypothetical protein